MKNHTIPVQVIAISSRGLTLKLQSSNRNCPHCESGEGCGNFPWFQGFRVKNHTIFFPSNPSNWQQGELAQIIISSQAITIIAMLTYGLPLVGFLIALLCSQSLSDGQQILISILITGLIIFLSHFIQNILVNQLIYLEKLEKSLPQKVKVAPKKK